MTDPPASNPPLRRRFLQFYWAHVAIALISLVAVLLLVALAGSAIVAIPRDGFGQVAAVYATLLGLTLAAFAVMTALLPVTRKDVLTLRRFLTMGQTFVMTMSAQLLTFLLAGLCYVVYGMKYVPDIGVVLLVPALMSVGWMVMIIDYVFYLFRLVRKDLSPPESPTQVL